MSLIFSVAIAWANSMARRYDDAIKQLRRTVELEPHYPVIYWILGVLLRRVGQLEQAIAEGEKGVKLIGGQSSHEHSVGPDSRDQILDDLTNLAAQRDSF